MSRGQAKTPGAAALAFVQSTMPERRLTEPERRFVRSFYNQNPDEAKRARLRALFGQPARQQTSAQGGGV